CVCVCVCDRETETCPWTRRSRLPVKKEKARNTQMISVRSSSRVLENTIQSRLHGTKSEENEILSHREREKEAEREMEMCRGGGNARGARMGGFRRVHGHRLTLFCDKRRLFSRVVFFFFPPIPF